MRNKFIRGCLALMLCVGAFALTATASATQADAIPPTVSAWSDGDALRVEAADADSGVEAVFINGSRVNYRVDGALEVSLEDYAGGGEYVSVYAVDFAGNKSSVVQIKNPYYTAPTAAPTPAPTQKIAAAQKTASPAKSAATAVPTPSETPAPAAVETAVESTVNAFTPDGAGTVLDNAAESDGKEFFTVTTEDESVFYLVIDRQRTSENVYLLNAVTEADLLALAEKNGGNVSATPESEPAPEPTPEPTPEPEAQAEPAESGGSGGLIFIVLLAVLGAGGAGYYLKIYKPRQQAGGGDDEWDEQEDDDTDFWNEPDGGGGDGEAAVEDEESF